jgi:lipoprotein-anchoring transpeptidase ErfK/SrfK
MSEDHQAEAARALEQAWIYLSQGHRKTARGYALQAAQLDPHQEGPWLVLAALGSPEESLEFLHKVLEINPANQRARQGLQWAMERIEAKKEILSSEAETSREAGSPPAKPEEQISSEPPGFNPVEDDLIRRGYETYRLDETQPVVLKPAAKIETALQDIPDEKKSHTQPVKIELRRPKPVPVDPKASAEYRRRFAAFVAVGLVACLLLSVGLAIPFSHLLFPSLASSTGSNGLVNMIPGASQITDQLPLQPVMEATATLQQNAAAGATVDSIVVTPTLLATITYAPTFTQIATQTPQESPTPSPTSTPPPTVMPIPVEAVKTKPAGDDFTGRWIDVDLANQKAYAYEDDVIVREFVISSGIASHPTVTGQYHIYLKYRYDDMVGPGYNLKDVPWVMYFYKGYGLHGTYWHNNFGHPMSHGCVNMRTDEAEWLYNFAPMGTLVNVH